MKSLQLGVQMHIRNQIVKANFNVFNIYYFLQFSFTTQKLNISQVTSKI